MTTDLQNPENKSGRGIRALLTITDWASYLVLTIMALVVCIDIASRAILGVSTQIAEEICSLGLVALIFLTLPGAFHDDGFLRIDALFQNFPEAFKRVLEPVFIAIGLVVTSVYIFYLARLVQNSFDKKIHSDGALHSPNYLTQSVMVIGLCALAIVLVAAFIAALGKLFSKGAGNV